MASGRYKKGLEALMQADITGGLDAADIKAVLVDVADYTVNLDTHDFLDDIAAGGRVATSGNLASKTTTNGVFDAADVVLSAVTGDTSEVVVVYWDTGAAATSVLLSYNELSAPVTPNGGDITIQWHGSGIFSL